jgi:mannose-6-phosphate isomerase-like protein (cupin superfamily)
MLQRGTLDVRFAIRPSVPPKEMTVHRKDEVYVVVRGRGVLLHGDARDSFESGDLLHVAAGVEHRFADMSEDLAVWVIFYGPDGGEVAG